MSDSQIQSVKKSVAICISCMIMAACVSSGPRPDKAVVQKSFVPIPVACSAKVGTKPDFADSQTAIAAATGIYPLAVLYAAGREQHYAYEAALEAAVAGCSTK